MEQIQEYNNSIYYSQNGKLHEFNLLSKSKRIHWQWKHGKLDMFHVFKRNLIGYALNKKFYLNGKFIFDIIKRIFIMQTKTTNTKYIIHDTYCGALEYELKVYNLDGNLIREILNTIFWKKEFGQYNQLDVSYEGQIITWNYIDGIHPIYILSLHDDLEITKITKIPGIICQHTQCVIGSSYLVVVDKKYVMNINTDTILKNNDSRSKYFETNKNTMIKLNHQTITIYDAYQLTPITQIQHNYEFIYYHKKLDILITKSCKLFVITANYKLKRCNIGNNYIIDQTITPNQIMEIIAVSTMLFELLPEEIVFSELYMTILKHSN